MAPRRPGGQPGNSAALKHGGRATKSGKIVRRATVERRRILRQISLRQSDLDSVGRALLINWSRAAAALSTMDEYAEGEGGWLDADGQPRGFARLYVSMLNAERLALRAFAEHLRATHGYDGSAAILEATARRVS